MGKSKQRTKLEVTVSYDTTWNEISRRKIARVLELLSHRPLVEGSANKRAPPTDQTNGTAVSGGNGKDKHHGL